MKHSKLTPELRSLYEAEASARARGLSLKDRTPTKVLAAKAGYTYGYAAQIVARMRRQVEIKVDVPRGTNEMSTLA